MNNLTASGYTAGHIGIQWAWFTISPNWGPYFPEGSKPGNYSSNLKKIAIVMTDGEFNTAFAGVPKKQNPRSQPDKSQAHALKLCENMKASGIKLFTIGFALKQNTAKQTMQNCASPPENGFSYYYEADDGTELVSVYKTIANRIKTIRVSK